MDRRELMLPDLHMHTKRCQHAHGMPEEYAREAFERGLSRIVFTDHGPLGGLDPKNRMALAELPHYIEDILALAEAWRGRLDIGLGIEIDWIPGLEDFNRRIVDAVDWDLILGSVHFVGEGAQREFIIRCAVEREPHVLEAYWSLWADAACSGMFQVMSHPDIYRKRRREPLPGERDLACRALDRAAGAGVAIECNTSLVRKGGESYYPQGWLLEEVLSRGFLLSSAADAHRPHQVGADFDQLDELRREDPRARFMDFRQRVPVEWPAWSQD